MLELSASRAASRFLLGANVGTTVTAWLVSFKLAGIGPIFIVLGMAVSLLPGRFSLGGRSLLYFGLILFALTSLAKLSSRFDITPPCSRSSP